MTDDPPPAIGAFRPPRMGRPAGERPDPVLVERLLGVSGLSSAFSDALDTIGLITCVPASVLRPIRPGDVRVGRVLTLRYLPARGVIPSRLAHLTAWADAGPGDILAIDAPPGSDASVLGGKAAAAAVAAGVGAVIVSGALRDLDEVDLSGLAAWSTTVTPITGRGRLDAVEINGPVEIAGVQVIAGDIAVADRSGVAFVPGEVFAELAAIVLDA